MTAEQIAERFNARRSGAGWITHCPGPLHAHGDKNPSLSIREGRDGRTILHCFAGCDTASILGATAIRFQDLFLESRAPQKPKTPAVRAAEKAITGLRCRLTPRERMLQPTIILIAPDSLGAGIARALALAVEGEIAQLAFTGEHPS